jgi:hypothetical protein
LEEGRKATLTAVLKNMCMGIRNYHFGSRDVFLDRVLVDAPAI